MQPVDPNVFRELQETAGADFVGELVETFLQEAPVILTELRSAWQDKSDSRFRRAAHSLKSNGATFGAMGFSDLARQLELAGLPADAAPIATLQASYDEVALTLREMCRE